MAKKRTYISDVVDANDFVKDKFNLIASGCGTGKSRFVAKTLLTQIPWVKPWEVLLITSRSLTVEQQSRSDGMSKYDKDNLNVVKFWNKENEDLDQVLERGIQVMTYDKIIQIITQRNASGRQTLERLKVVIFDECHILFSDTFIENLEALKVWIRDCTQIGDKMIVGMTATPEILYHYVDSWGVEINEVTDQTLPGYMAKNLVCTNFESIPYLVGSGKLPGKTLIMCPSVKNCYHLQSLIPNSAVLISPNNPQYTKDMDEIRTAISVHSVLPDFFDTSSGERRELKVLITTSTAREGFNLLEESGVKNIVSCYTDPLHITQFAGRARYDLENIVVADTYIPTDNRKPDSYLTKQRKQFKEFLYNEGVFRWFIPVAHLVNCYVYDVIKFALNTNESAFISYINTKWLVPVDATREEVDRRKIWKDCDKKEIMDKFCEYKLSSTPKQYITFNSVIHTLKKSLGYEIDSGRESFQNKQHTYKLIISFDEDKVDFEPPVPPIGNIEKL